MVIDLTNNVGPFMGISRDKKFEVGGRKYRLVIYGAYNCHGLIGSEINGIAILDEDNSCVLLDRHCKQDSGYYGPSRDQIREFERILEMDYPTFVNFVNHHQEARYQI